MKFVKLILDNLYFYPCREADESGNKFVKLTLDNLYLYPCREADESNVGDQVGYFFCGAYIDKFCLKY